VREPTYGRTASGQPVHARTRDYARRMNWAALRRDVRAIEGFNAKLAVLITSGVGTMACAYAFAILALVSLPDAIHNGRAAIISWIAQTFLQLVLLSIIMVGQRVQSIAADARAAKTFEDVEAILDRLDIRTQGGIKDLHDSLVREIRGKESA
jgi:hypothetical protein